MASISSNVRRKKLMKDWTVKDLQDWDDKICQN